MIYVSRLLLDHEPALPLCRQAGPVIARSKRFEATCQVLPLGSSTKTTFDIIPTTR